MDADLSSKLFRPGNVNAENPTPVERFGQQFLETYLRDGLGVMSKKETEILVVSKLDELGLFQNLTLSEASRLLRITESRIATLRYESLLRYPPEGARTYVQRELMIALLRSDYDQTQASSRIHLMIENKYVRSYLRGEFIKQGKILDRSFDSDIAAAKPEALFSALGELFAQDFVKLVKQRSGFAGDGITREAWDSTKSEVKSNLIKKAASWGIARSANITLWLEILQNNV